MINYETDINKIVKQHFEDIIIDTTSDPFYTRPLATSAGVLTRVVQTHYEAHSSDLNNKLKYGHFY